MYLNESLFSKLHVLNTFMFVLSIDKPKNLIFLSSKLNVFLGVEKSIIGGILAGKLQRNFPLNFEFLPLYSGIKTTNLREIFYRN